MTIDKNILMEVSKKHPACSMNFDVLYSGLMAEVEKGNVNMSKDSTGELELFDYSLQCQFEGNWNVFTLISRGLILCPEEKRVVSLCMPKFFNVQELEFWTPHEPFSTLLKVDGSCLFLWHYKNEWHCSTRGSFYSDQAKWALDWAKKNLKFEDLNPNVTYICEVIYPENRVVVKYDWEGLVFLTAYNNLDGHEYDCHDYVRFKEGWDDIGFHFLEQRDFSSIDEIVSLCEILSANEEGFVVQFQNGLRMKIKSKEYVRVHKIRSNMTPLFVWECLANCDNLDALALTMPEEWRDEFYVLRDKTLFQFDKKMTSIKEDFEKAKSFSDKEIGLSNLQEKKFVFLCRKKNLLEEAYRPTKLRRSVFETFRPKGNVMLDT